MVAVQYRVSSWCSTLFICMYWNIILMSKNCINLHEACHKMGEKLIPLVADLNEKSL